MKAITYLFTVICIELVVALILLSSCSSPASQSQQASRVERASRLENNNAEYTTEPQNHINSGNLTDSTNTDTGR